MPNPIERAAALREVLNYSDSDIALVRESMDMLVGRVGVLMGEISGRLVGGSGEEAFFDDDPDRAQEFGSQLSEFVMKATAGKFTDEYCEFVAAFPSRLSKRPPMGAFIASIGVISGWLCHTVGEALRAEPDRIGPMLAAWQKMLAVNLALLVSSYDQPE